MRKVDIVILGGGIRGLNIAVLASELGLSTVLIENVKAPMGYGLLDYPIDLDKAWFHLEKVIQWFQTADLLKLSKRSSHIDVAQAMDTVRSVMKWIQEQKDWKRYQHGALDIILDHGRFIDEYTVCVEDEWIQAKQFIIATGSKPAVPLIPCLKNIPYFTEESILQADQLPKRLIMMGDVAIGLEMAQVFRRLGSQVTVIDKNERLLSNWDHDMSEQLQTVLMYEGIQFYFSTIVKGCKKNRDDIILDCTSTQIGDIELTCTSLLIVTERTANIEMLGLDKAGVKLDYHHRIMVDKVCRTSNRRIYAIGDVTNIPHRFTNTSEYHAGLAIASTIFRFPKKLDNHHIPSMILTDPPLTQIGLNEQTARLYRLKSDVIRYTSSKTRSAAESLYANGEIKLLIHDGHLIGATLFGEYLGKLIAELVLAIQMEIPLRKLIHGLKGYPMLSNLIRGSHQQYNTSTFMDRLAQRWLI